MADDPVAVSAPPHVSGATVVWRHGGMLYVTVIAKQSLAFEHSRTTRPTAPSAVVREETDAGGGRVRPDELAPCVPRGDLWAFGHVAGAPGASLDGALRLVRGDAVLLEKTVRLTADADGQAFLGPLGPVSKRWPARARRLGSFSASLLEGAVLAVPEGIDWAYFQAAPADQQVPWIAPRDVVTLTIGDAAPFTIKVPADLPQAVLGEPGREAQVLVLRPDSLSIDVDARRAHLVYRARAALSGAPQQARVLLRLDDDVELALAGTLAADERSSYAPPPPPPVVDR